MTRAAAVVVLGAVIASSACSGGGDVATTSPCPLLARLARTGETVAAADVTDPEAFDTTLRAAVTDYVRMAKRLRTAVPLRLRADVERILAAAEQHRFADASSARDDIDAYARDKCASE